LVIEPENGLETSSAASSLKVSTAQPLRPIERVVGRGFGVGSRVRVLCNLQRRLRSWSGVLIGVAIALAPAPRTVLADPVESRGPVRLSGWAGYQFTGDFSTAGGIVSVDPAPTYGAAVTYAVDPEFELQALWTISDTHAHFAASAGPSASSLPNHLNISYFQAGITKTIRCGDFECFGDVTVGAVLLLPGAFRLESGELVSVHDTWRLAFTLGAGVRFFVIEKLAVVVQARLLAPVYVTSGGFYSGTGAPGLVVGAGIACFQGAFSVGLVLVL
jgi:hypothetical protein